MNFKHVLAVRDMNKEPITGWGSIESTRLDKIQN